MTWLIFVMVASLSFVSIILPYPVYPAKGGGHFIFAVKLGQLHKLLPWCFYADGV